MNVGALLARVYLALGSPDRALRALEQHLGTETTPGMEAEFQAWWGLVLACLGDDGSGGRAGRKCFGYERPHGGRGSCTLDQGVSSAQDGNGSPDSALDAFRFSVRTGNLDAFVTSIARVAKYSRQSLRTRTHTAISGWSCLAPTISGWGVVGFRIPRSSSSQSTLTKRERDVVGLLAQGATNKEIDARSSSPRPLPKHTCVAFTQSSGYGRKPKPSSRYSRIDGRSVLGDV